LYQYWQRQLHNDMSNIHLDSTHKSFHHLLPTKRVWLYLSQCTAWRECP
jgi:hypothetical protein